MYGVNYPAYQYQNNPQAQAQLRRQQDQSELMQQMIQFKKTLSEFTYPQLIQEGLNISLQEQKQQIEETKRGMANKALSQSQLEAKEVAQRKNQETLNRLLEKNILIHNEFLKLQSNLEETAMQCSKLDVDAIGEAELHKRITANRQMFITIRSKLTALNTDGARDTGKSAYYAHEPQQESIGASSLAELKNAAQKLASSMKREYEVLENIKKYKDRQD